MLAPLVSYLMKIDRDKWNAFRARLKEEGRSVKWAIEELISRYIEHGFDDTPKKGK